MSAMTGRSRESHIAMSPTAPEWLKPDKCRKLSLSGARVPKAWSSGILLREVIMAEQKAKHDKKKVKRTATIIHNPTQGIVRREGS